MAQQSTHGLFTVARIKRARHNTQAILQIRLYNTKCYLHVRKSVFLAFCKVFKARPGRGKQDTSECLWTGDLCHISQTELRLGSGQEWLSFIDLVVGDIFQVRHHHQCMGASCDPMVTGVDYGCAILVQPQLRRKTGACHVALSLGFSAFAVAFRSWMPKQEASCLTHHHSWADTPPNKNVSLLPNFCIWSW